MWAVKVDMVLDQRSLMVLKIPRKCYEQSVNYFFKQWGGVCKSKTGRMLNGRTYDEFPDTVQYPMADLAARRMQATTV